MSPTEAVRLPLVREVLLCTGAREEGGLRLQAGLLAAKLGARLSTPETAAAPDLAVLAASLATERSWGGWPAVLQDLAAPACAILFFRAQGKAREYRRLLVHTDLAPSRGPAFTWAETIGAAFEAEVLVLHVVPLQAVGALIGIPDLLDRTIPSEAAIRRSLRHAAPDLALRVLVEVGSPSERIREAAREEHADLVVVCTRREPGGPLGPRAERLVREAPCDVLVCPLAATPCP